MHALSAGRAGTYVHVEPRLSMTAANADQWLRNAPGTEGALALAMLKAILDEGLAAPGVDARGLGAAVQGVDVAAVASRSGVSAETIKHVAHNLAASKAGLAIGGGAAVSGTNATDTQVAINLLNVAIGAVGKRVRFGADAALGKASAYAEMLALTQAMAKGEIEVLILGDVNPVFTMPAKAGFAEALAKVPLVVSLANRPSESNAKAHIVLPALHWLESWGDYAAEEGVVGLMQPAMGPVEIGGRPVDAKSVGGTLLSVGRQALGVEAGKGPLGAATFGDYVKAEWTAAAKDLGKGKPFVEFWEESLRRGGVWRETPAPAVTLRPEGARVRAEPAALEGSGTHALLVVPLGPLLRRPRRRSRLAAGSARPHDPGDVGRLGGDSQCHRGQARSRPRRPRHADLAPRPRRPARVSGGGAASRGGGGGAWGRATLSPGPTPSPAGSTPEPTRSCSWGRRRRPPRVVFRISA